jgi:Tol biopolymer transport system component/predicted Ser/Thr protein kinase
MAITSGSRLGPYEILAAIGAGGMGEVWKARDTRLDRTVAVKVLPPQAAASNETRQRFEREARAVSALNHPHICTLYDIGSQDGIDYLVMEYVEGETLAQRLQRGAMALGDALETAIQIAEALDKAHRSGIVHRDLKPGNVMLGPAGVKILDFGLAKMVQKQAGAAAGTGSVLQTVTTPLTGAGSLVGTLQYMSPEQLEGKEADQRSDIFAFGAVLHETIAGRRTFDGRSQAGVIAAILEHDPPSIRTAQPRAPEALERLVSRCLEKDPERRWQSAGDLAAELRWIVTKGPEEAPATVRAPRGVLPWIVAAVCFAAAAASMVLLITRKPPEVHVTRFALEPPPETNFMNGYGATAVSPDGRLLVFAAVGTKTTRSLWLRPLDSVTAEPLAGTGNGNFPFWSPDGKSLAFFVQNALERIDIGGGPSFTLCQGSVANNGPIGGTWNRQGIILFAGSDGLYRISASGGVPVRVTEVDEAHQEAAHGFPEFLPDGNRFLYLIRSANENVQGVYLGSLGRPRDRRRIVATAYKASYHRPQSGQWGWLLWTREQTLLAQAFDEANARLTGEPIPVAQDIALLSGPGRAAFWASDGLLAYRSGQFGLNQIPVWMGRDGKQDGLLGQPSMVGGIRLSPDAKKLAMSRTVSGSSDIWLMELSRDAMTRFTFDGKASDSLAWSPDGKQIAFASDRTGTSQIYRKDAAGAGSEVQLTSGPNEKLPTDWSRDGKFLLYTESDPKTVQDIWALPLEGDNGGKPIPVVRGPAIERRGVFSPDGKWIAYESFETGRPEVYVQPFPPTGAKWMISTQGGTFPRWRGDGRELYYVGPSGTGIMAAAVRAAGAGIEADMPKQAVAVVLSRQISIPYDVTSDGQRFLVLQTGTGGPGEQGELTVVENWQAGLKK